ncbi:DgyrCDS13384 [Dimorphilus gyrociliatus]|uniref:DgyrCDS13384 n=1 Tax=Dimorphilus gyrociliatus TaxID=2664684 RepID=A0A7I8WAG9_9ANNE|nr:DgyrCDS13384 [Dimorphilus gyrociliatus]
MRIKKPKRLLNSLNPFNIFKKHGNGGSKDTNSSSDAIPASVYHALVIIFLEFFSWGLLTLPIITVLKKTFDTHTLLMNGIIQGIKGFLSFLSAPLIGALSDIWGRKPFLLLTVTFTCAPIPLMKFSPWWYFAVISISGIFTVTFSVVFAYVSDVTTGEERNFAYGLVSATFAASLVTSPAIGAHLSRVYSDNFVVALATSIAILDIIFILVFVPESLPEKLRPSSWGSQISWEKADPFGALRKIGHDPLILILCITVFLSYLPEAGEYSSFFVYLKLVMGFDEESVALYMAVVGVLSVIAQTAVLSMLMHHFGAKHSIIIGLTFEMLQLAIFGFGSQTWLMWMAGGVAALGSITYPAISAFVSSHAEADQQGVAQGMITGIRGLCNGLGPAVFGLIFYLFDVNLNETNNNEDDNSVPNATTSTTPRSRNGILTGPPFAFGAILVILAIIVAMYINKSSSPQSSSRRVSGSGESGSKPYSYEIQPLISEEEVL